MVHKVTTQTDPSQTLMSARNALGRMAHRRSILLRSVTAEARELLLRRGLVVETTQGYLDPTHRASGYCHNPGSFESGGPR